MRVKPEDYRVNPNVDYNKRDLRKVKAVLRAHTKRIRANESRWDEVEIPANELPDD